MVMPGSNQDFDFMPNSILGSLLGQQDIQRMLQNQQRSNPYQSSSIIGGGLPYFFPSLGNIYKDMRDFAQRYRDAVEDIKKAVTKEICLD